MTYFFITSLGRSGTKFFANLINQSSDEVLCYHEPYRQDYSNLPLSYYSPELKVVESNLRERFQNVQNELSEHPKYNYYGEVNSLLRYNTQWLQDNLKARVVHIVRDPKKVVPSIYARNVYKEGSSHLDIVPKNNSPYAEKWHMMNRFEKICWYWSHTNDMLLNAVEKCVKFEDLVSDYRVFSDTVGYLGIPTVPESLWKHEISKPKNTSKKAIFRKKLKSVLTMKEAQIETIGAYSEWTTEMRASFHDICGPIAKQIGYDFNH